MKEEQTRQKEIEERKPAFFQDTKKLKDWREEEFEAWKKLQKETEMNFDPEEKSEAEMRAFFRMSEDGKNALDDMSAKMFESLHQRLRFRQVKFYAFLNKEFNQMNYKSARCSMHCFDDETRDLRDVKTCLSVCREGIKGCHEFTNGLQREAEAELRTCVDQAQDQKNLTDPIVHWISCYEKLVLKFDAMEEVIKDEFSNFI